MADSICSENQLQRICETVGCSNTAKLQCPTCIKLGIPGSYFCSQDCFKKSWSTHKQQHKKAKGASIYDPWPDFTFSGKLRPWPVTPKRVVPDRRTPHSELAARGTSQILVLSDEDQESLRVACKLGREVLDIGAEAVAVGVTTDEIDRLIHEATIDRDCYPSPLNYYRFPKSCCTSVNEVICHGIPDKRPLTDGDIVNIDVTVYHRGFHGDLNETLLVGNVDDVTKKLVGVTWDCLDYAMQAVKPGMRYRDIGAIIQKHAQANGFSVVRSYCGHGIHRLFHTAPNVPHYAKNKAVGVMKAGHSFTIEPMISEGVWRDMVWPDNWTAVTQDGRRSAQFEHTLLVTDTGVDILTQRPGTSRPHFMDQLG